MHAKPHFDRLALYNRWANRRLYETASALTDTQFREDRGAFFGSLCGTLNHLLVADRIWLRRIEGTGPQPSALNQIFHEEFAELRAAREAEDERLIRVVGALTEQELDGVLSYRSLAGTAHELPLALVLSHVFNHQTHHRGQAHTLLSQFGLEAPVLDLVYFALEK